MTPSLLHAWKRTLRADPDAPALVDAASGRVWSRRDLDLAGQAWADRHGPGVDRRIVLLAEANGFGWFETLLGLLARRAVVGALDPGEPVEARRALASAAGAAFLWDGALAPAGPGRTPPPGARLLKFTSGSTGRPRALFFTDAQMLADGRQICAAMRIAPKDRNLGLIPFGHSYGLGNLVVPLLAQGTAIVTGVSPLPEGLAAAVERWTPTVFPSVPPLLKALAESGVDPSRLRSLRTVISAGARLDPGVARKFLERFGIKVHNFYGSSETGGIAYDPSGDAALAGTAIGEPIPGVRLAFGRGKRFTVQSPAVYTLGNRRNSVGPGIHSPADLGRLNDRGELELLGRRGRMLKLGARRLDPAEVERALLAVPRVKEAFVAPDPRRPDTLAAVVAGAGSATGPIDAATLRAALADRLAAWKLPRRIVVCADFPRTARGKPDRLRLLAFL